MKLDVATKLTEQGLKALAQALQEGHSEALEAYLGFLSRFHHYSFQNCILIASQRADVTHVAGFNAWKKMAHHVKKGEKGIAILASLFY